MQSSSFPLVYDKIVVECVDVINKQLCSLNGKKLDNLNLFKDNPVNQKIIKTRKFV